MKNLQRFCEEEEEGRIKQTRLRCELSSGAAEGGVYPRLCYPFQMLLAALRGSAHVSALSSVVLPRLLHRSSAAAAASLHFSPTATAAAAPPPVYVTWLAPKQYKVDGRLTKTPSYATTDKQHPKAGAEVWRRKGGRCPAGRRSEAVAARTERGPIVCPLTHSSSYPDTLHYTGGGVSPGKGGHWSSTNALIEPVFSPPGTGRSAPVSASASLRLGTPEVAGGN